MPAVRVSKNPNLTRRAKQAHNDIIAKIVSAFGKREVDF
jgi:hypothetical protein